MTTHQHIVAIFGAGVAGSEAAYQLAQHGISVVVFEKNLLPYGKIEEGLPKWHIKLRNQEEDKIDAKLYHPEIQFVPGAGLGDSLSLPEVLDWGFSAVLLAIGAEQDRPLPVPGINEFIGKGLYYQNPLVSWFNHKHEPGYSGERFTLHDGALVIGGGLASLDVVKIVMLEITLDALQQRGVETDLFTLEKEGIARVLKETGFSLASLGLTGCTLFYRRKIEQMPLTPMPPSPTPEKKEKAFQLRRRILQNYRDKFLFRVKEQLTPVDKIVEQGRLSGLVFQQTKTEGEKTTLVPGSEIVVKSPLVVSSIGSVPGRLPGIPYRGELIAIDDPETGRVEGFENVFALGNAVTGRGNIRESMIHGRQISRRLAEDFLWQETEFKEQLRTQEADSRRQIEKISAALNTRRLLSPGDAQRIVKKVKQFQQKAGYPGNYPEWIARHKPPRLEEMLGAQSVKPSGKDEKSTAQNRKDSSPC